MAWSWARVGRGEGAMATAIASDPGRTAIHGVAPRPRARYYARAAHHRRVSGLQPPTWGDRTVTGRSERRPRVAELLLQRVAAGDRLAVGECIDRFGALVWSLARRAGFAGAEAEDAVQ